MTVSSTANDDPWLRSQPLGGNEAIPDGGGEAAFPPGFDNGMRWVYETQQVVSDRDCEAHYRDDPVPETSLTQKQIL